MMFFQQLQKLQSQGMGPMNGGSSGSSGGGGMSGANGRDGGTTGSSGGISGQGNIGNNNFGGSSGGGGGSDNNRSPSSSFNANAFGSLASANQAAVAQGSDATSSVSTSGRGDTDSRRGPIASAARSSFAATAPTASKFGGLSGTPAFGGPQSSLVGDDTGLAQSSAQQSSDRSNEMGMANVGFSDRMNRAELSTAIAADKNRHVDSGLAKFGNFLASAVAPPVGTAVSVGRAGIGALNTTRAQQSVDQSLGMEGPSTLGGMASNLASPVGGYLGGQAGGRFGAEIGSSFGPYGTVAGGLLGAVGGQMIGSNMAQGIVDGRGSTIGGGIGGSLSNAAGINMGGGSDNNQSLLGTGMQTQPQQPANQPQGNAYGWQGYDSSFGNYGSHNSQFVGNPNRARNAFR